MTREELIAALEAAEAPSRELDARIALLAWTAKNGEPEDWRVLIVEATAKAFTASIDAALTLVPEGWAWAVKSWNHAECKHPMLAERDTEGFASTPAIGLCITALKAGAV